MDQILLLLLRKGAHQRPLRITTSELGELSGMSQQNASAKLIALEREGLVQRGKDGVMLTKSGYSMLAEGYATLKNAFEGNAIEVEGTITRGLGEGGYYVSMAGYKSQIRKKLGFDPFPGTLNLRLEGEEMIKRQRILDSEPIIISGFKDEKRTYGDLFAYRCKVGGQDCAIIVPIRTHHGPDIIELISQSDLKRKLSLKDGDKVRVVLC